MGLIQNITSKLNKRSEGDCSGGSQSHTSGGPSVMEELYKANIAITIDNNGNIKIIKDKYSEPGVIGLHELLIRLIKQASDGSLTGSKLFDWPVKEELIMAINRILNKYNII